MKVQEALNSEFDIHQPFVTQEQKFKYWEESKAEIKRLKSALSEIGECEPVAEALHERNRLGYAVVDVIGTLDEIIENAQEVEVDDFLHIAIPIDKWHELQDALEEMPKRAELYTSPQPIEKCEPELYMAKNLHNKSYATSHSEAEARLFLLQSSLKVDGIESEVISLCRCDTSPQPRDWVGLTDKRIEEIAKLNGAWQLYSSLKIFDFVANINDELKQLNTKG